MIKISYRNKFKSLKIFEKIKNFKKNQYKKSYKNKERDISSRENKQNKIMKFRKNK